jgi:uncharacterized membrane protein YoaK (UPF0700 family)
MLARFAARQILQPSNPLPGHPKAWLAIGLAWSAAFVDVVGWLTLRHIYTAHMTGNTASFGYDIAERDWMVALQHGWPLIPFMSGLLFGAAATAWARRKHWHSSFSIALATELFLLCCFIWLGRRHLGGEAKLQSSAMFFILLSLPSAAMGLQTVTVTRVMGLRVYTTYLTGSLTKLAEALVHYAFWFYDRTRGRFRRRFWKALRVTFHQKYAQHALLTGGLWCAYALGAICGALLERRSVLLPLLFPCFVLTIAIIVDLVRPVAAADEPEIWDDT